MGELAPVFRVQVDLDPDDLPATETEDVEDALRAALGQIKKDGLIFGFEVTLVDVRGTEAALRALAEPEPDEPLQGHPENVRKSDEWIARRNAALAYVRALPPARAE